MCWILVMQQRLRGGVTIAENTGKIKISPKCDILPPHCRPIDYQKRIETDLGYIERKDGMVCQNQFDTLTLKAFAQFERDCLSPQLSYRYNDFEFTVAIKPLKHSTKIVDESFGAFQLGHYTSFYFTLHFIDLRGFDIESKIEVRNLWMEFFIDFNLYKRGRLVKGCEDFSQNSTFIFFR